MRRRVLLAGGVLALVPGCAAWRRRPPPAPVAIHYVVGAPYRAGGTWRYPRAEFDRVETGLAVAQPPRGVTLADGAPYDPSALIAVHPTLQLPSVARVTNLETGRAVTVRIDGRGPEAAGRALALSPRAMALLGPGSEPGVLRVRLEVDEAASRRVAEALAGDAGRLAVAAAPSATVREEALPPPPGASGSAGVRAAPPPASPGAAPPPPLPLRLPEDVTQGPVGATTLAIDLGGFTTARYAALLAARFASLGARVEPSRAGRERAGLPYRVRLGPLATVAQADAVLDRTLAAGVADARIVVDEG